MENRKTWIVILVVSSLALITFVLVLLSPTLATYCDIHVPFITITKEQIAFLGLKVQRGMPERLMLVADVVGVLIILRICYISMLKLGAKGKDIRDGILGIIGGSLGGLAMAVVVVVVTILFMHKT
jgi:hypothetical protein